VVVAFTDVGIQAQSLYKLNAKLENHRDDWPKTRKRSDHGKATDMPEKRSIRL